MPTLTSCHFGHLLQVSKKISLMSDFIHFFMILYMYIAPGQGQTAPRGQSLMSTEMSLHSFVANLKQISLKSNFIYLFIHDLILYIAPGQEQNPRGQNFDFNRKALSF